MGWPGLAEEVVNICLTIGLQDITKEEVTKEEIKERIMDHHIKGLKKEMEEVNIMGPI